MYQIMDASVESSASTNPFLGSRRTSNQPTSQFRQYHNHHPPSMASGNCAHNYLSPSGSTISFRYQQKHPPYVISHTSAPVCHITVPLRSRAPVHIPALTHVRDRITGWAQRYPGWPGLGMLSLASTDLVSLPTHRHRFWLHSRPRSEFLHQHYFYVFYQLRAMGG